MFVFELIVLGVHWKHPKVFLFLFWNAMTKQCLYNAQTALPELVETELNLATFHRSQISNQLRQNCLKTMGLFVFVGPV